MICLHFSTIYFILNILYMDINRSTTPAGQFWFVHLMLLYVTYNKYFHTTSTMTCSYVNQLQNWICWMTFFQVFIKALVSNLQNDFASWKQVNCILQVHYASKILEKSQADGGDVCSSSSLYLWPQ